ncbi:hypothetical protein ACFFJY_14710 [Fictibacillus aquaticus]|nr:hypothetical protein [Fictibacillus aquaticus]
MKIRLLKWSIILAVVFGAVWTFQYVSNEGKFTKRSHTTVDIETLQKEKAVYIGYDLKWEGLGAPVLQKAELIKTDNTIVAKDDKQILIRLFINKTNFGAVSEEEVIKEGLYDNLLPVRGYKADGDFSLVLRVELVDKDWNQDIKSVKITYKKFGITHVQNISFSDGIITNK